MLSDCFATLETVCEEMFKAILVSREDDAYQARLTDLDEADLPEGDVTVDVHYSTLNYKDCLAITGRSPVVRKFPMVPGVDLAGEVKQSESDRFKPGDRVILNGWGVGETHWGGLAERARLKADWLLPLPVRFSEFDAMSIGTAGYTAMLCLMALERQEVFPGKGRVLVTGATGGVGSYAVSLLAAKGYKVIASTGRPEEERYLKELGAAEIIPRSELDTPGRPLSKERWAGAIDTVGGVTLANVCASTQYGGAVAACGLAGGMDFPATVAPFILRGVALIGVDSVYRDIGTRKNAWDRLADELPVHVTGQISRIISLDQVIAETSALLAGRVKGRLVVRTTPS